MPSPWVFGKRLYGYHPFVGGSIAFSYFTLALGQALRAGEGPASDQRAEEFAVACAKTQAPKWPSRSRHCSNSSRRDALPGAGTSKFALPLKVYTKVAPASPYGAACLTGGTSVTSAVYTSHPSRHATCTSPLKTRGRAVEPLAIRGPRDYEPGGHRRHGGAERNSGTGGWPSKKAGPPCAPQIEGPGHARRCRILG
jgi:hypothetical protein